VKLFLDIDIGILDKFMAVQKKFQLISYSEEIIDGVPIYVSSNCLPIKALRFEPAGHAFNTAALRLLGCEEEKAEDGDDLKVVDDKEQTYVPSADSYSSKSKKKSGTGSLCIIGSEPFKISCH